LGNSQLAYHYAYRGRMDPVNVGLGTG
jgi:hypothetical protein